VNATIKVILKRFCNQTAVGVICQRFWAH